ncbi:unnamed protein product [Dibothriocephalus latus]|uniref:SRCR domain-containing protein n=1 Tax=Dibothriocephalus latus TaxID=60516 RepID=A0A3P7LAA6_DIBLA|nr:unnamed protein product [Dibothriocephalus latus]
MKLLDRLYLHLVLACCLALAHSSSSSLDAPQKPPMGAAAEQSDADRKVAANASKESHNLQSDEPQGPSVELNYGISADRHGILSCENTFTVRDSVAHLQCSGPR